MHASSPIARLMLRVRFTLIVAGLVFLGVRQASAEIKTAPDFPVAVSKSDAESVTDKLLSMYCKDVGTTVLAGKISTENSAVRSEVAGNEGK